MTENTNIAYIFRDGQRELIHLVGERMDWPWQHYKAVFVGIDPVLWQMMWDKETLHQDLPENKNLNLFDLSTGTVFSYDAFMYAWNPKDQTIGLRWIYRYYIPWWSDWQRRIARWRGKAVPPFVVLRRPPRRVSKWRIWWMLHNRKDSDRVWNAVNLASCITDRKWAERFLLKCTDHKSPGVRTLVLESFFELKERWGGFVNPEKVSEIFKTATSDPDPIVANTAKKLISKIKGSLQGNGK